ncbi:hypothetical protein LCGC14_1259230 [marine sediment metagenome]|uniref:SprT-like domain-containing protein n=1 Tax=marine sediment metagenome TaxID=412755 RepID=A0A0F9NHV9_9ZZZZ
MTLTFSETEGVSSGFTKPDGEILLDINPADSSEIKLILLLHEWAHVTTKVGHSCYWWQEAKRLYVGMGVLDAAMITESHYARLWDDCPRCEGQGWYWIYGNVKIPCWQGEQSE